MTNSPNSSGSSLKDQLYGHYQKSADDQHRLYMKAAHKSLDIAENDDGINVTNQRVGLGVKELLAIGALVVGGGAVWQAPAIIEALRASRPSPTVTPAAAAEDFVSDFRWDAAVGPPVSGQMESTP